MIKRILKTAFLFTSCLVLALLTTPVHATLSNTTLDFMGQNGIYYYNPEGSASANCLSGSNATYSGSQILSAATTSAIQANQAFYKNSADKYGFDWRIIAVIHIKESSAKRSNPANGQGAYQLYSYTRLRDSNGRLVYDSNGKTILDPAKAFLPAGQISDEEFQRQTDLMADLIANQYGAGLDLNTAAGIKTMFFNYNGRAQKYIDKAIAMGFTAEEAATGEGSPYVMNQYDAARDPNSPNMSPLWPGAYVGDGQWSDTAVSAIAGAYTMYVALGGVDGGSVMECYIVGANGGRLVAGANGMTLEEAQEFMESYKNAVRGVSNADLITLYGMTNNSCSGGVAYNCVSFSRYFINMYTNNYITNHITVGLGNGRDIADSLISGGYAFTDGGSIPQVYAIFSVASGSTMCGEQACGHTGVVLGINTNTDTIIIGEAACGLGEAGIKAKSESLSKYMSSKYRYAYPNSVNGIY